MNVELPFKLSGSFTSTDIGSETALFAEKVFSLSEDYSHLKPNKLVRLLNFSDENIGVSSIQAWIKAGIFKPENPQLLTREETVVLKLIQMNFAAATPLLSFSEAHTCILGQLQGSGLERFIGNLEATFSGKRGQVTLLDPSVDEEGHWWVDTTSATFVRRKIIGHGTREKS